MYRFYILTYSWAPNQISDGRYSKFNGGVHTAIYDTIGHDPGRII